MEFNDGSKYVILKKPELQVQAGRTLYAYKGCGASGSTLTKDPYFDHHRNLRDYFKGTLIYQFVYAHISPEASAEFFVKTLGGELNPGEMVAIDPEVDGGFDSSNVFDYCRRWLAVVETKLNTKAWIYTAKDFNAALAPLTKDRVKWVPRYNTEPPSWSSWDVWQNSDKGPFPGSDQGVGDTNQTSLTTEQLLARCNVTSPPEVLVPTVSIEQLLNAFRAELGKSPYEVPAGSNKTVYGKEYGFDGVPWCLIFASVLYKRLGIPWRFASTVAARREAERRGLWRSVPKPGMGAMKQYTSSTGHWGEVEFVHSDGTVTTIEANTSPTDAGSQREGDGVYRKRRSISWWSGFVDIPALIPQSQQEDSDMGHTAVIVKPDGTLRTFAIGPDHSVWHYVGSDDPSSLVPSQGTKIPGLWKSISAVAVGEKEVVWGQGMDDGAYVVFWSPDKGWQGPHRNKSAKLLK